MRQENDYPRYLCPCCGYYTYPAPAETEPDYVCPVCRWENDLSAKTPDQPSVRNRGLTLAAARQNYRYLGACRADLIRLARKAGGNERPPMVSDGGQPLGFYGGDQPLFMANTALITIHSPRDLYRALLHCWSLETCASGMRRHWSPENPTLGQCSITSFIAQDVFGGKVYGVPLPTGFVHCYNQVGNTVFDLTSEQFRGEILDYRNNPEQFREDHFAMPEKRERYETLKAALLRYLGL